LDFFDILLPVVMLGSMLILLAMGLEIAWSLAIAATIGLVFFLDQPINQLAYTSWDALDSFTMSALPLFVLMGAVLSNSGVSEYLFDGIEKWLGRLPGGLATSTIGGNAIFGAMCGSSVAATATFDGSTPIASYPAQRTAHYLRGLAACIHRRPVCSSDCTRDSAGTSPDAHRRYRGQSEPQPGSSRG